MQKQEADETPLSIEYLPTVAFCNSKSVELFGIDLVENTLPDPPDPLSIKLDLLRFIPLDEI